MPNAQSSAVLFVPYDRVAPCAAALLAPPNERVRRRLATNAQRLADVRRESLLLAPALAVLFPACRPALRAAARNTP